MTRNSLYRAVRRSVNAIRQSLGYGPVRQLASGKKGSPKSCPVARSLPSGYRVVPDSSRKGYYKAVRERDGKEIPLDRNTSWFVKAFDEGEFKELAL